MVLTESSIVFTDLPLAFIDLPIVFIDLPLAFTDSPLAFIDLPLAFIDSPIESFVASTASPPLFNASAALLDSSTHSLTHRFSHSSETPVSSKYTKQSTYNDPFDDGVASRNRRQPSDKRSPQLSTWDPTLSTTWTQRHPEKLHRRPTANQMTRTRYAFPAQ